MWFSSNVAIAILDSAGEGKHRHYSCQKYITVRSVSFDFHFWSWKKFSFSIHPNDNHVVKCSDYLLENYVVNYSDFPLTLWADFISIMLITTATSRSIQNSTPCFILHTRIYISLCTGIKKIQCNTHMKCWDKHETRTQNVLDKEAYI
jgi:hypothetical protein